MLSAQQYATTGNFDMLIHFKRIRQPISPLEMNGHAIGDQLPIPSVHVPANGNLNDQIELFTWSCPLTLRSDI